MFKNQKPEDTRMSVSLLLLVQALIHLPRINASSSLYSTQTYHVVETEMERGRRTSVPSCTVEHSESDDFDGKTNCSGANVGETCLYFCQAPYFLDNLTVSMFTPESIPGFGPNNIITYDPSLRYCASKGSSQSEWYKPDDLYYEPQCLNEAVYDKLISCTSESPEYNAYICHTMRNCFIEDETGVGCTNLDFSGPNQAMYYLYDGFFNSTPNVTDVDFTSNYLGLHPTKYLKPNVFQPIRGKLQVLTMTDNYVNTLNGMLRELQVIQNIYFSNNVLTNIESDAFQGSESLVHLELDNNRIVSIENGAFANLENLEMLYLNENYLTYLDNTTFAGQLSQSLKSLDLSSNQIEYFHPDTFVGLSKLRKLLLSKNALTKIEPRSFVNLNLVRLSLDNNNIHSLMNGIFEGVNIKENTGEIDLSDNPIVEIYEDSIQDILCDTARFVLSTDGTSACACNSTTRSIFCSCRGGSAGSSNSTVGPPTACKIPIITSIGVSCNPSQEDNGCDRTEEDTAISGPFSSTLQDEVIAFSEMVGNNIEHVAPSTEGSDFLILTFDSSAFLRTSSSEYVSAGNAFLKVENRKGEACVLSENHLKCGIPEGVGMTSSLFLIVEYTTSFGTSATFDIFELEDFHYAEPKVLSIGGCSEEGCDRKGNDTIEIRGTNFGMFDALVFVNREICDDVVHGTLDLRANMNCTGSACHRSLTCRTPALTEAQSITSDITNTINIVQANLNGFANEPNESFVYRKCGPGYKQYLETDSNSFGCSSCDAGSYSNIEDAMICDDCTEGRAQANVTQTQCEACPVNYAASVKGMTSCEECPYGKSTKQTGSEECEACPVMYWLSEHCDFPVFGIILGIILFFVVSFAIYFLYRRRKQYLKTKADLLAAKKNQRTILMRDRLRLKNMWMELIDSKINIGANITPYVRVELHASPHDECVVLGTSHDTHMWLNSDNTTHRVVCKNFQCDSFPSFELFSNDLAELRRLTRHDRIAYCYGWITSREVGVSHRVLIEFLERRSLQDLMSGKHRDHEVSKNHNVRRQSSRHDDNSFSWMQTLRFALDILEGLCWLHENEVCHGNLKPSNVLVTAVGGEEYRRAKLTDAYFLKHGTRRGILGRKKSSKNPDAQFVRHLQTVQISEKTWIDPCLLRMKILDSTFELTPKSDVYSLGIVLRDLGLSCPFVSSTNYLLSRRARSTASLSTSSHLRFVSSSSSVDTVSEKSSLMLTPSSFDGKSKTSEYTLYEGNEKRIWNQLVTRCTRMRDVDRPSSKWIHRRLKSLSPLYVQLPNVALATKRESLKEEKGELLVETTGAPPLESYPSSPSS